MHICKALYFSSVLFPLASAFYIPGWSIRSYKDGDAIPLYTNKITSSIAQISFAYDELSHVCQIEKGGYGESTFAGGRRLSLNIGELLRGDRITISDYELRMGKDIECQHLCTMALSFPYVSEATTLIEADYVAEWIVDNLPGSTAYERDDKPEEKFYVPGFELGYVDKEGRVFINNHVSLVLRWRKAPDNGDRKVIVGFEVYPLSISGPPGRCPPNLEAKKPLQLVGSGDKKMNVPYTYSVYWKEDETIEWSRRWDRYFVIDGQSERIHWLAIFNCLVVAMLLTGTVGVIMVRTLSRDIQNYNERDSIPLAEGGRSKTQSATDGDNEGLMEDITGWKLVHGDIFRPPRFGGLYAPVVGTGIQTLATCVGLLIFGAIGVLNPSYRGGFMSFALFFFVLSGVFSGYCSSRVYKTFKGENWLRNAITTAFLFPALLFCILFFLNGLLWANSSSSALPFTTILAIISMWLLISTPLTVVGAFIGTRKEAITHPGKTTLIPRQIPTPQPWFVRPIPAVLLGGIVPFGVIFIELLYVFKSFAGNQSAGSYYYFYGFLIVIFAILLLTTIEVTIISIYFQLCAEDYNWWWRSFSVAAGSAIWIFVYAVWYASRYMAIRGFLGIVVYFGYVTMACLVYASVMGVVGICAAWWFVKKIYGAVKSD